MRGEFFQLGTFLLTVLIVGLLSMLAPSWFFLRRREAALNVLLSAGLPSLFAVTLGATFLCVR